jgi:hypothetical protein
MKFAHILKWRQYQRAAGWLLVALLGALMIDHYPALSDGYTGRWLGACLKAATGAWGGYRISRDICRIDPSNGVTGLDISLLHLARAIIVVGTVIAICVSI